MHPVAWEPCQHRIPRFIPKKRERERASISPPCVRVRGIIARVEIKENLLSKGARNQFWLNKLGFAREHKF